MALEIINNNGTEYLRLVTGKRITDASGKKSIRKKIEFNIEPAKC